MHLSATPNSARRAAALSEPVLPQGRLLLFALVTAIFFFWGMSNNLSDILVQQFRKSFELTLIQAQLVQTAVFAAYAIMAVPAALLMRRFGYKAGILTGLLVFASGTLLFWPAAVIGRYGPFLAALFIAGCGQSILETACNPFIAQLGAPATSERRLNLSQAFNPPGTITGVLIGTFVIFSGVEKKPAEVAAMKAAGTYAAYLHSETMRVVPTYVALGAILLLLAFFLARMSFPAHLDTAAEEDHGTFAELLRYPHLLLAVLVQFFYVGAQVGTWSTFIPYLKAYTRLSERSTGYFLTGTLIALALGRIVSTPLMRFISPARMIGLYGLINIALLAIGIARPGLIGGWAILLTSFFMSVMFPTIFALGVKGLGRHTKLGGSLIVMAILGGAIFPPLMSVIARRTGNLASGYFLPMLGYAAVALFGLFSKHTAKPVTEHDVNLTPEVF